MEDRSADATAAQEELGHARQLFNLLEEQGRDENWLQGERDSNEYYNTSALDEDGSTWIESLVKTGLADRAAWLLLDAINHPDFEGLVQKIGEEEYFHLEHQDGRMEEAAETEPENIQSVLADTFPHVLAFLGPADYTEETDPLYTTGFITTPANELRTVFFQHYTELFKGTDVSLDDVNLEVPTVENWNEERRRLDGGHLDDRTAKSLQWGRKGLEFDGHVSQP